MARSQCVIWPSGIAGLVSLNRYCKRKPHHCPRDSRERYVCACFFSGERLRSHPHHRAYRHRTPLPAIAGYEGVGIVTETPAAYPALLGKRVLPLRGREPAALCRLPGGVCGSRPGRRRLASCRAGVYQSACRTDDAGPLSSGRENGAAHRCRF